MQHTRVHTVLSRIDEAFGEKEYERSLALSRDLKRALLAKESACDPLDLGWARFYEFKSLYELGEYQQAYELLGRTEPATYAVPQKNAAYMFSVGAELAMHLGLAEEVIRWGEKCLEMRLDAGDRISAVQCANTVCVLLARLQRDDLNARFARFLIETGKETGAERPLIAGYRFLAANITRSGEQLLMVEAVAGVDALRAIHDDEFSGEAIEALGAIVFSPWYVHALAPADRRQFLIERALFEAADAGDLAAVRDLVGAGVDVDAVDAYDRTPLVRAAFSGHTEVVRFLLEAGAELDRENIQRRTAIIQAADRDHAEIVELLVEAGADVNARGICDQTALIVASWQGNAESVAKLLRAGAETEIRDAAGDSALTLTASEAQPVVVSMLLEAGADIEARNRTGQTALMKAAMEGHEEVVAVLLEGGADSSATDEYQMTAADWAAQEGFAALARRLRRARRRRSS